MSLFGYVPGNYDRQSTQAGVADASNRRASRQHREDDIEEEKKERTDAEEEEYRRAQVGDLARQLTRQSSILGITPDKIFNAPKDSPLDPNSSNFDSFKWAKAMLSLVYEDPEKHPSLRSGVAFKNLAVHGYGSDTDFQNTVGNMALACVGKIKQLFKIGQRRIQILHRFDGLLESGDMLVVLGPPGSGCSTFLKTLAGETHGFAVEEDSYINYRGIPPKKMHKNFRGETIYTAEVDVHFPNLTVGDTLEFAARARSPRNPPGGVSHKIFSKHMRDVFMAIFGISHTLNTRVGNDFVRGVSGGERKRVSIAEAALSMAPFQCWDNSTRGLDSANAIEFCKTLKMSTDLTGTVCSVAIYQAPQAAYDTFNKVTLLYDGRQIYFGPAEQAKKFFVDMGFHCPDRQTTPDFLTSLTSPAERRVREGFENKVPQTPDEFARAWQNSETYAKLIESIDQYDKDYPIGGEQMKEFAQSRRAQQSRRSSPKSPYTLSYMGQIMLCLHRGFQRLRSDPSLTISQITGNTAMALIISSIFYNLQPTTESFYQRGALLFFALLFNAFGSALEILTLYAQRPIVEKHQRYAFYHPSAEAFASMLTDMPYKIVNAIFFNLIIYFMSNLRREPGPFFFFLLMSFFLTLTMSMFFRTIASVSRTLQQALAPAAVMILALVIFTGFTLPTNYMLGWSRWINYLDPIAYGFESLMINEFHDREFACATMVPSGPGYENVGADNQICNSVGARPGSNVVNGDAYINSAYQYYHSHKWRNFGIVLGFMFFLMATYLVATELISAKKSKGEVLVFRRGHQPKSIAKKADIEASVSPADQGRLLSEKSGSRGGQVDVGDVIQRQTAIFHWQDVCYDIKIKGQPRRILDHVDGWVKPGTLTALMGASGAGKTTLLDVLAGRVTVGVVTGQMLVDGKQRDQSFQRKTGYVQQQDLHLQTSTVREALTFSAILRQPAHVPEHEKREYVEQVIKILEMEDYADAVVGVPGEGLNVEQRKRLTIGVELAAKPQLLLFLDEPTSGLDSQTSWAICDLMEKLMNNGQAILCTIHQPSAMLFQRFNRLLFLAAGGKTVYFGEIGENSSILTNYFERNGAKPCPPDANPAEWMLEVIGAAPGSHTEIDWPGTWNSSPERDEIRQELATMKKELPSTSKENNTSESDKEVYREFAAPFRVQLGSVLKRVFQQYWRTPSYIYSKLALCVFSSIFIGFAFFKANNTQQGLQNQMFAVFMLFTIFGQLLQQILPNFVTQRALYEVRERPSKAYSWKAFMISNIIVELPWNSLMAVIIFFCWYYPIGLYRNAEPTDEVHLRGFLMFLLVWMFLLFTSSFANMIIAGIETAETAAHFGNLMFMMCLLFNGVLASKEQLPGFWIFMYRVSPFNYLCDAILSTAVANTDVQCAQNEYLIFNPVSGQTCEQYMQPFMQVVGGYLQNPPATSNCSYCAISSTNAFLARFFYSYSHAWRNFGILWAYVLFNIAAAVFIYWFVRVPKKVKAKEEPSNDDNLKRSPSKISKKSSHLNPEN